MKLLPPRIVGWIPATGWPTLSCIACRPEIPPRAFVVHHDVAPCNTERCDHCGRVLVEVTR